MSVLIIWKTTTPGLNPMEEALIDRLIDAASRNQFFRARDHAIATTPSILSGAIMKARAMGVLRRWP